MEEMKILWLSTLLFFVNQTVSEDNLLVTYNNMQVTVVNRNFFSVPYHDEPFVNMDMLEQFADKLDKIVYRAPINAKFDENDQIIQERPGSKLNLEKFYHLFLNYYFSKGSGEMEIPVQSIYPRVDSELLSQIHTKQIGQYVTYFNSNNTARTNNISLAANAIDNFVVFPGEVFSFNKVVGMRTVAKGYLSAPVIVKGELSEGIGGGICQVSSTLFNAVDNAGLKIVKRYSHSKLVPYVPPGRDATVSWYGPDFSFQNKYNQPIIIRTRTIGGRVIIKIYSSDFINYEPRKIPSASEKLPKEILTIEAQPKKQLLLGNSNRAAYIFV